MTDEELDEARAREAMRISTAATITGRSVARHAARLAREGWTPPEPVDPDLLAAREWLKVNTSATSQRIDAGEYDNAFGALAYLAGCARGRQLERAASHAPALLEALERARDRALLMNDWIAEETLQINRIGRCAVYVGEIDAAIAAAKGGAA